MSVPVQPFVGFGQIRLSGDFSLSFSPAITVGNCLRRPSSSVIDCSSSSSIPLINAIELLTFAWLAGDVAEATRPATFAVAFSVISLSRNR